MQTQAIIAMAISILLTFLLVLRELSPALTAELTQISNITIALPVRANPLATTLGLTEHGPSTQAGSLPDEHLTHSSESVDVGNRASTPFIGRIIAAYTQLQQHMGVFLHTHPVPNNLLTFIQGVLQNLSITSTALLLPHANILTRLNDELHHAEYGILPFANILAICEGFWQFCQMIVQVILCIIPGAQRHQTSTSVSPAILEAGMATA